MRVIALKTLRKNMEQHPDATGAILSWLNEVEDANWDTPNELKAHYRHASIISGKRVVFNIHGNSYRLIVDIEFKFKIVFIIWFGTHHEYDKIDASTIKYHKTNPDG